MSKKRLEGVLLAVLLGFVSSLCAQESRIAETRSDLDALKRRIEVLQKDMARTEASKSEAMNAVTEIERAVSKVARQIQRLSADKQMVERKLVEMEAEQNIVEARIVARQDELADWLRRYYIYGSADSVASLLSARDPNQMARDVYYLKELGQARFELIESLRFDLRQKADQAEEIGRRRDHVLMLEKEQRAYQVELVEAQKARRQALLMLSEQLKSQQKEVNALRQDEERLTRLIDTLARRAREAAVRQEVERQAAEQRRAAKSQEQTEAVVGEVKRVPDAKEGNINFAQLRGKLRFPVQGALIGRFGALRVEGGTTWKGVFIRSESGKEVRAVAAGEVVFSDWLRGYGNLLIIDHGGNYLSVYGNNDALFKEVGDRVTTGDAVASVGSSGGGAESGLYFEIRHQGLALDPLAWMKMD